MLLLKTKSCYMNVWSLSAIPVLPNHGPRQSWETTFSINYLKLENRAVRHRKGTLHSEAQAAWVGAFSGPMALPLLRGGWPPEILRHCYWALQDFNRYLFTITHFVILITRKNRGYPKTTDFWSAFIKTFYPVIFEILNYWAYIVNPS